MTSENPYPKRDDGESERGSRESVLEIEDVDVELGGERILTNVRHRVDEGRFIGLVGPNGAGKTTLIRTMNAVLTPDDGTVFVAGDDVSDLSSKEVSRRTATVPQNTSISFEFTVRKVVGMGRYPHVPRFGTLRGYDPGAHEERVEKAMKQTQVHELADRSVEDISGGERQRVLLARALAQDADLLLLDEPTSSLDINHQSRTLSLVRRLSEGEDPLSDNSRTVVAALHDIDAAARFCDELVLLDEGKVVSSGTPHEVVTEENLQDVFGTHVDVVENPSTGTPQVTVVDGN
ncbi:MAG: ATP-binding cassette domain-containing protein [Halobacteria archaeon]|nr:ATP-binding cassette domain-containing protein [Halobacteria archaeon]